MTRTWLMALGAGAFLSFASAGAHALPVAGDLGAAPLVERVAEGCGPRAFRNARGFCRPMRGVRRGRAVRRCVVRITRFGRERVCRVVRR